MIDVDLVQAIEQGQEETIRSLIRDHPAILGRLAIWIGGELPSCGGPPRPAGHGEVVTGVGGGPEHPHARRRDPASQRRVRGRVGPAEILIEAGADVNSADDIGFTPLFYATTGGSGLSDDCTNAPRQRSGTRFLRRGRFARHRRRAGEAHGDRGITMTTGAILPLGVLPPSIGPATSKT